MSTYRCTKYLFPALAFLLLNGFILSYRYPAPGVSAQSGCREPPLSLYGIRETWPKYAEVGVNIDSFWGGPLRAAIEKAFDNWESAGAGSPNCSRVVFHPATNDPVPAGIVNATQRPAPFTVQVIPAEGAGFQMNIVGVNGRVESELIFISSCKTDPLKTTSLTAHEIGHSFGLGNCTPTSNPSCSAAGQSIMGLSSGDPNDVKGCGWSLGTLEGPTYCDNTTVALYYCDIAGPPPGGGGGRSVAPPTNNSAA